MGKSKVRAYRYKVPPAIGRKIKKGDTVVVRDSQLNACGYVKVARTCRTFVETVDERHWRPKDGYWLNEHRAAFPFPSIKPVNLRLKVPARAWIKRLRERGFTQDSIFDKGQYEDLKTRLLNMAGHAVVLPVLEEDYDKLMRRARPLLGQGIILKKGAASQCHSNAANLWDANREQVRVWTGYAMSEDGCWRQHSWCVLVTTNVVVETTIKRRLYWGFEMSRKEAEQFLYNNW